ncbi:MAG: nucleotidyltransferase domain-containing protein [Spirochaetales bacterium]|nr:nucleotidyltransferase domain-containing protein [Spirochaetales bacterium]
MTENHKKAIRKLISLNEADPAVVALILCGSCAAGTAKATSDVDLYKVVTEEAFFQVEKEKAYFYGSWDPEEYFGVEIDGKIVGIDFLYDAVVNANEPTRASFLAARALFSHERSIDTLIKKIAVYPELERDKKIRAFYAYVKHYRYTCEGSFKSGNSFHAAHCAMELIFFAARLVLAHNRVLFPCHKSLFDAVARCTDMPDDFIGRSSHLLRHIDYQSVVDYYDTVAGYFSAYDYPDTERIGLILENEWTWHTKKMTISEW